jgi:cytochrome c oxidase cbb3-type subunit 4
MDITTLRIIATLVSFATFVGIMAWAYAKRNRGAFDEAAQLPFANDESGAREQLPGRPQ